MAWDNELKKVRYSTDILFEIGKTLTWNLGKYRFRVCEVCW